MPVRKPALGAQFYASVFDHLNTEIEDSFCSPRGPGALPVTRTARRRVLSVLAPHSPLRLSGPCQAWAFKELAESRFPSTFVILGTNHTGLGGPLSTMLDPWQTPLGTVKTDKSLCMNLVEKAGVRLDFSPFVQEHSVEMQLPFLQYASKDRLEELRFVPVVMQGRDLRLCQTLAKALAESEERCCLIVSSDLTHYGLDHNYVPFAHNRTQGLYALDGKAIELILNLDAEGFLAYCEKTKTTICGQGPIATALEFVKLMDGKKGKLLQYYTSGDVLETDRNAIGFAAMSFESLD